MQDMQNFTGGFADTQRWRDWCAAMLRAGMPKAVSLDLFCGAGGLGLGMAAAGLQGESVDMDRDSLSTHGENIGGPPPRRMSISADTDWSSFTGVDIVMGGPPCQPFSMQGSQKGTDDSRNGFPGFLQAIETLRPRVAVAENVKGLLQQNTAYLQSVMSQLKSLGYSVEARLLKAEHYGVPQRRERVFLAAWTSGRWEWPAPFVDAPVSAGVALGVGMGLPLEGTRMLTSIMDAYIAKYEQSSSCKNPRDIHPERSSRTVTTRNLASATSDMLRTRLQDGGRRMLSLEEGALLQSFPVDFKFHGKPVSVAKQIGNAVPPLMGLAVARAALRTLGH